VPTGRRRHEPAELTLTVRRLDDGRLRFGTPTCPGWAFTAHRPSQIGEAIARAYTEAAVAAYARLHGVLYDVAAATDPGAWRSPTGRRYAPDSRQVQAVVASLGQGSSPLGAWQTPLR
jgi:hypothetical protein